MIGDETNADSGDPDITDRTDHGLIMDISETFAYLSNESRVNRKKQKLRKELVRAHIEQQIQAPTILKSLIYKLTRTP